MNDIVDNLNPIVLHIGKKRCGRDWNYRDVCSPFMRIYYITDGSAEIDLPDGTVTLQRDNMYLIPAFTPHNCRCTGSFEHFYVHLYHASGAPILEDWQMPVCIPGTTEDQARISRLVTLCPGMELRETAPCVYDNTRNISLRVEVNLSRQLPARIESRGIIMLMLARFMQTAVPKTYVRDERISGVLSHIRANIATEHTLDSLASLVHLSREHLLRLFKKEMNMTPLVYINVRRIELAQLRLLTEPIPIKEIAYSLGFDDPSYFNRLFKKYTGMTPRAYRLSSHLH